MNNTSQIGVLGLGAYVPERVLTNHDLEKMIDTSDEWITTRTGIKERRIASEGEASSDLGAKAALKALEDAKVDPAEIDAIVVATLSPDHIFPATACIIQEKIGAVKAAAFDLSAGCSGFVYALAVAYGLVQTGLEKVLVIGAETISRFVNWQDRSTCVLFGDGAGAVVLGRVERGGILGFDLGADGSGHSILNIPVGGSREPITPENLAQNRHYLYMVGSEVFRFAVRTVPRTSRKALKKAGLEVGDVDWLIPHQANTRIIDAAVNLMGIESEKVVVNLDKYGNTSAASIPIAWAEAAEDGRIKRGDKLLLVGFGAGLTWASMVLEY
ncbi:MAG: beta-ketoacyl-ACP synthase III [Bacillota bacterium]|jgi:3-oxoacyl-[acyl-carrier-protein] synthase-3|nr:beta-ketoacyl-ACP synthase III [Bacillota bacterium]NLU55208.1 ketoacyl-ACP synthase III [Bacillota bacterium]HOA91960.1 beta-ketoacyl-ACP synthase III [Bacillota bacterium]HOJ45771.1 beta-ketoacyl-ACP synthase III [Bacillota bacterium]HOL13466.1 beta-ketoacyl-ACP synthase III [Bacillota bacterium]